MKIQIKKLFDVPSKENLPRNPTSFYLSVSQTLLYVEENTNYSRGISLGNIKENYTQKQRTNDEVAKKKKEKRREGKRRDIKNNSKWWKQKDKKALN